MTKTNTLSRRSFLRPSTAPASAPTASTPAAISGLQAYSGPWTSQEAGHLLSRATMGANFGMLNQALELGLEGTLDSLLRELPPLGPPPAFEDDGITTVGETWVDQPYPEGAAELQQALGVRRRSLYSWHQFVRMVEGISARETMALFWHNHFAINHTNEPRWNYLHAQLLRRHAFGNFRQFVKDITIDPLMLAFLNGTQNTVRAPNENYARELLELFTVGKGPQAGPGDYTNYTEEDVIAMARSLTGWRNQGARARDADQEITPVFVPGRHDSGTVTLSPRFDRQEFPSSGADTYANLVDLIFEKKAVSEFIVRKLYRWFVYYEITEETEATVIQPLAQQFREGDYEIKPVLRTLLASQHFFDVWSQGPMIKHPIRSVVGTLRQLGVTANNPEREDWRYLLAIYNRCRQIGMADYQPPNVAGWKAYYQEPLFYRQWINSSTLVLRKRIVDQLFALNSRFQGYGAVQYSLLEKVEAFPEPADLWGMIDQWVDLLFPRPIPDTQREFLKEILLPGLPDTQWAVEYADYRANPDDINLALALEFKLRRMVKAMLEMPEFQLS